jgi:hypothetical protein
MAACHPEADGSSNDAHVSLMLQNPPDDSRNDAHVSLMLSRRRAAARESEPARDRGFADSTIDTSAVIAPETAQLRLAGFLMEQLAQRSTT